MNRRKFLRGGAFVAALAGIPVAARRAWAAQLAQRPFTWRDAENRTEVRGVAVSPDGERFALETTRPLAERGEYGGSAWGRLLDPRGDIWLLDGRLGKPHKLSGTAGGAWSACFSPDGRRLAALTLVGPGKVGLSVWDLGTGEWRILSGVNVEVFYATFGTARSRYGGPSGLFQIPRQYEWLDSETLLVVDHGPAPQQSLLAIGSLSATVDALRHRAQAGRASVRVWSDHASTCGASNRLVKIRCDDGTVEAIYIGDVRGVSLSPNRDALALMVATTALHPMPNAPMQSALRQDRPGDDSMVASKLAVIDLVPSGRARDVEGVTAVGCISPSRLPLWSEDGARIAVPVRSTYSDLPSTGDDAAWEFTLKTGATRRFQASSALDAELLAALLTTEGLDTERVRDRRPQVIRPADYTPGGQIRGGAWPCGPGQVMLWNAPVLSLITPARNVILDGEFASVQPPVHGDAVWRTLAHLGDDSAAIVTTWAGGHKIEGIAMAPDWEVLGVRPSDAAVVCKDDSGTGTFLMLTSPGAQARRSPLSFNTYFRDVAKPKHLMITRRAPDGVPASGMLLLPTGHQAGQRHPVIVWAYPNSKPSPDESLTKVNDYLSVVSPIQYLLAHGFAFFHAPFQIDGRKNHNPMRAAVEAVLPWLDVLDGRAEVIAGEYGFFGHSNAGYVALALEALSDRFKVIVAWSTFPEIGYNVLHSDAGDVALNCAGNLVQSNRWYYEDPRQPYVPRAAPPWSDPGAYVRNDPIFNLGAARTPLLLVEGEFDADPREMEAVYSILYGKGVPVELAYYWGEGHVLSSPGNVRDSWRRTERFFARYLRQGSALATGTR